MGFLRFLAGIPDFWQPRGSFSRLFLSKSVEKMLEVYMSVRAVFPDHFWSLRNGRKWGYFFSIKWRNPFSFRGLCLDPIRGLCQPLTPASLFSVFFIFSWSNFLTGKVRVCRLAGDCDWVWVEVTVCVCFHVLLGYRLLHTAQSESIHPDQFTFRCIVKSKSWCSFVSPSLSVCLFLPPSSVHSVCFSLSSSLSLSCTHTHTRTHMHTHTHTHAHTCTHTHTRTDTHTHINCKQV